MLQPIRVLVVDDSALMRHRLSVIIGGAAGFEVAGSATNGRHCLEQLDALQPDVITLDVEMPGMDGLATLDQIMRRRPTPVIMVSSLTASGAQITLDALSLGAVDYLAKPSALSTDPTQPFSIELLHKLGIAAQVGVTRLTRHTPPAGISVLRAPTPAVTRAGSVLAGAHLYPAPAHRRCETLVVIGSSTGGPQALDRLFSALPTVLPAAFLVVQHMPPLFTQSLAARLDRRTAMQVREAAEGDALTAGVALVAPGNWHLTLSHDARVHLDQAPPVHGVRPAIDRTLLSISDHWKRRCLAVILTGMGVDGTEGARALHTRGAEIIVQDEESCIVYGMPRSVAEAGLASAVLPLDAIAPAIEQWAYAGQTATARPA